MRGMLKLCACQLHPLNTERLQCFVQACISSPQVNIHLLTQRKIMSIVGRGEEIVTAMSWPGGGDQLG